MILLKHVADINAKSLNDRTSPSYDFHYLDLSCIEKGQITWPDAKISFANSPSRARRILSAGDIIMATVRPNLQAFAFADFEVDDVICSTGFALITPRRQQDGKFIYQNIYSASLTAQIKGLLVGSNYPAINSEDVSSLKLLWPSNRQESDKIGRVLFAADREIEVLEQLKTQQQEQKKGLMQQLLTGKRRVMVEEVT
ncbi:hypothetical protein ES708_33662 [subsurface metagenome]